MKQNNRKNITHQCSLTLSLSNTEDKSYVVGLLFKQKKNANIPSFAFGYRESNVKTVNFMGKVYSCWLHSTPVSFYLSLSILRGSPANARCAIFFTPGHFCRTANTLASINLCLIAQCIRMNCA